MYSHTWRLFHYDIRPNTRNVALTSCQFDAPGECKLVPECPMFFWELNLSFWVFSTWIRAGIWETETDAILCRSCHELDPIAAFQSEVVRVWKFFFGLAQGVYTYVHICRIVDEHAACCQTWDVEKFGVKCSCGLKYGASGSTR